MALIKCPECGKDVSDKALACPNCGFPVVEYFHDDKSAEESEEKHVRSKSIIQLINTSKTTPNGKKSKVPRVVFILLLIAIFVVVDYPSWNRYRINSQTLNPSEILGQWDGVTFNSDYTADILDCEYVTGKWEIVSDNQNTIRLYYDATDEQVEQYYKDRIEPNIDDYTDGFYPTSADIVEELMDSGDYEMPEDGMYHYERANNRLVNSSDEESFIER